METRASYVLIGAFALAVFVAAFGFVLWLGKLSLEREWVYYDIVFEEAVTGLTVGGAVQYNGIQVGEVRKLSLAPDDPRKVIAHVRLNGGTPVKTDTHARLNIVGLTGVTVIQLSGGTPGAAALMPAPGEAVAHIVADVSAMQSLLASGQDVAVSANESLVRLNLLLSDANLEHVAAALGSIDEVTRSLAAQRGDLHSLVTDISDASRQLKQSLQRIDRVTASTDALLHERVQPLLDDAHSWLISAQRTTDAATALLDRNREPIERFTTNGLAQLAPTLIELRATLRALRSTSGQLQDDPAGYLIGRERPKEFQPK
ncbi:MlaD family protein [Tahibacter sp.]|uniref:MlaD family protein n=1 Tax=Tahibacter sp. TaxID=2056211 RepID=UPI0028C4A9E0|nr:MlaD family protein [Tahibacter sp.]